MGNVCLQINGQAWIGKLAMLFAVEGQPEPSQAGSQGHIARVIAGQPKIHAFHRTGAQPIGHRVAVDPSLEQRQNTAQKCGQRSRMRSAQDGIHLEREQLRYRESAVFDSGEGNVTAPYLFS